MKYTPYGCITQATLCGLSPHGELALQANARLTPYLKLGGCASALLNTRQLLPMRLEVAVLGYVAPDAATDRSHDCDNGNLELTAECETQPRFTC